MADKKIYSAQEAAIAVLAKTQELLVKSELAKSKNPDEKQDAKLGERVEHLCEEHMLENKDAERKEGHKIVKAEIEKCMKCESIRMKKSEFAELHEDLNKLEVMFKGEAPPGEIKPKEPQAGESEQPGKRIEAQTPPGSNPVEQKEGNNPVSGTIPGHYKLAAFCGHMHSKRKLKKGIALS